MGVRGERERVVYGLHDLILQDNSEACACLECRGFEGGPLGRRSPCDFHAFSDAFQRRPARFAGLAPHQRRVLDDDRSILRPS